MFVYGVDEATKEYIVVDSFKSDRDSCLVKDKRGVQRPGQRVKWQKTDDYGNLLQPIQPTAIFIVQITDLSTKSKIKLKDVPFFAKTRTQSIPEGESSEAYLCNPMVYSDYIQNRLPAIQNARKVKQGKKR